MHNIEENSLEDLNTSKHLSRGDSLSLLNSEERLNMADSGDNSSSQSPIQDQEQRAPQIYTNRI